MTLRDLPQELVDATSKGIVQPFFAIELLFGMPNDLRLWNGYGDLKINGLTYSGAGELLQISDIRESSDLSANGATFTLSSLIPDFPIYSLAKKTPYQGRPARVYLGLFDPDLKGSLALGTGDDLLAVDDWYGTLQITESIPTTFFELFTGYMDQMTIESGPEAMTLSVSVENRLIDLKRPRLRRYTDNAQQAKFSGDLAFEFVNRIQDEDLTWGS